VFTEQLAKCMFEKRLIQKALYSINDCNTQGEAPDLDLPGRHSIVTKFHYGTLSHHKALLILVARIQRECSGAPHCALILWQTVGDTFG
jgi:hypothetical protein